MSKDVAVAVCRCGHDPAMLKTPSRGFLIRCENPQCSSKPSVSRPRGGQAVQVWNRLQGVITDAAGRPVVKARVDGTPRGVMTQTLPPITLEPISIGWRDRLRSRIRRGALRFLWTVSRPGWRACRPKCSGKFHSRLDGLDCEKCGLPYSTAEAEELVRERLPDLREVPR